MGHKPVKYSCGVNGVIKKFGMTGICSKAGLHTNLCHSENPCQNKVELIVLMPKQDD